MIVEQYITIEMDFLKKDFAFLEEYWPWMKNIGK